MQIIPKPLLTIRKDRIALGRTIIGFLIFGALASQFDLSWFTPGSLDTGGRPFAERVLNGLGWAIIGVSLLLVMRFFGRAQILLVGWEGLAVPNQSSSIIGWDSIVSITEVPHSTDNALAVHLRDSVEVRLKLPAKILMAINSLEKDCGDVLITFVHTDYGSDVAINAIENHFPVQRMH